MLSVGDGEQLLLVWRPRSAWIIGTAPVGSRGALGASKVYGDETAGVPRALAVSPFTPGAPEALCAINSNELLGHDTRVASQESLGEDGVWCGVVSARRAAEGSARSAPRGPSR